VLAISFFYAIGFEYTNGHLLAFGQTRLVSAQTGLILAIWLVFASVVTFLAAGVARLCIQRWRARIPVIDDATVPKLVALAALLAFIIPCLLRFLVLRNVPITDDETTYLFASRLLAKGDLTGVSPPFKLFYDRYFFINDGHWYTQYFLGWPFLMLPGTLLGAAELMNPLYSALTVPPLFWTLDRLVGSRWALLGLLTFLISPMLQLAAATMLSHTSCAMLLMWGVWWSIRSRDPETPWRYGAAMALAFCGAFFIRPLTALGFAAWPVLAWAGHCLRARRWQGVSAFALVAMVMGFLFLAINLAQNGSPFRVAYNAAYDYAASNGFRFSLWTQPRARAVTNLDFQSFPLVITAVALFRLAVAGLGWPLTAILMLAGALHEKARLFVCIGIATCAACMFTSDAGIDALIGPTHYHELGLVVVVLTVLAFHWLAEREARFMSSDGTLTASLFFGCVVTGLLLYVPMQLRSLAVFTAPMADTLTVPRKPNEKVVVFTAQPFLDRCTLPVGQHLAFWPPANDPALQNDVLWLNHLSLDLDRKLMSAAYPDRTGYIQAWTMPCQRQLIPLTAPSAQLSTVVAPQLPHGQDFSDVEQELDAALGSR
jgi:hypothetical protein